MRIILSILLFISCTNKKGQINNNNQTAKISKKEFYEKKMKEKNFQLENNGPCNDAFDDTLHKYDMAYFESKSFTDTSAFIAFKFKSACCQEFLGDYVIENDTLIFKMEQVNTEACKCLCWNNYKLTINEPKSKYKDIKIEIQ